MPQVNRVNFLPTRIGDILLRFNAVFFILNRELNYFILHCFVTLKSSKNISKTQSTIVDIHQQNS